MIVPLLFTFFISAQAATFPANWKACDKNDPSMNECLKNAITIALKELSATGDPSLEVSTLDPGHFKAISVKQGSGPDALVLDFKDLIVTGFKTFKILNVVNDWKNMEIHMEIPGALNMEGKYKIDGKILSSPISGEGHCKLVFDFLDMKFKLKISEKEVQGKKYYNVDDFDAIFDTNKVHFQFDNLFNGDKALGDNMNAFLNDNWKDVLTELKPGFIKGFVVPFRDLSNRVFSKIDVDQISSPK